MAQTPRRILRQYAVRSGALGKMHAIPVMAMSLGFSFDCSMFHEGITGFSLYFSGELHSSMSPMITCASPFFPCRSSSSNLFLPILGGIRFKPL